MAESYVELIEELTVLVEKLEKIGFGSDTESVEHNGKTRNSIAAEIKSKFSSVQSMINSRLAFKTKSEMILSGVPAANSDGHYPLSEVWGDSRTNNGLYGWVSGTGWVKSEYDTVNTIKQMIFDTALKFNVEISAEGFAGNGASFYDGSTSDDVGAAAGGWIIPAGQTGKSTYSRYKFNFDDVSGYVGRIARFVVVLECSSNALANLNHVNQGINTYDAAGVLLSKEMYQESPTRIVLQFDYQFSGDEDRLATFIQVGGNNTAVSGDVWVVARSQSWAFVDVQGNADVLYGEIDPIKNRVSDLESVVDVSSGDLISISDASGGGNGGASLDSDGLGFDVPVGQSGQGSYRRFRFPVDDLEKHAGTKIRIVMMLVVSDGFFNESDITRALSVYNSDGSQQLTAVFGQLQQVDSTHYIVNYDWTLTGNEKELGPYFQINTSAIRTVTGSIRAEQIKMHFSGAEGLEKSIQHRSDLEKRKSSEQLDVLLNVSSGSLNEFVEASGSAYAGAVLKPDGSGFDVPVGQSGKGSYRRFRFPAEHLNRYPGSKIRIDMMLEVSDGFFDESDITRALSVYNNDGTRNLTAVFGKLTKVDDTHYVVSYDWTLTGNEESIGPYFQINTSSVRSGAGSIKCYDVRLVFLDSGTDSLLERRVDYLARMVFYSEIESPNFEYTRIAVVKAEGGGDFTSLKSAVEVLGDGKSLLKRTKIELHEGIYTDVNYHIPNFVDVVGIGKRDKCWLRGELAADSVPIDIEETQTVWVNKTSALKNLKVTAKNMRYPIHSDSGASDLKAVQLYQDCYVEHFGNQAARDWQAANGGDPDLIWSSRHAFGCGTHSGQVIISRRTEWVSETSPFYFHTNKDFDEPCYVELDGGRVLCTTDFGHAVVAQALGSGQPDRLVIKGTEIIGNVITNANGWLSDELSNQPANRMEIEIILSGSTPVAWGSQQAAETIGLVSVAGAGSSVSISGTAADALFGGQPDYRDGGVGLAAKVFSVFAINGDAAGVSMGARLGDCSSENKVLNIVFDGSINKSMTLNADYTAMTNAQVLSSLNTILNDPDRSFVIENPWNNAANIHQPEHELTIKNTGATSIIKGMAVAVDNSKFNGRVMSDSADVKLFAGVALDDIAPGKFGRIQKSGCISSVHVMLDNGSDISFGDEFSVSSTPGVFSVGGGAPVMVCSEVRNSTYVPEVLEFL